MSDDFYMKSTKENVKFADGIWFIRLMESAHFRFIMLMV